MLTFAYHLHSMKWIASASVLLGTAPTYYAVWGSWRILSSLLPSRVFESGDEFLYAMYQKFILFFFENCSGVEIILYGDIDLLVHQKENVVFMSNHQCTVDWMVADMLAVRQGSLGRIRYILKDGLRYLPLYGYYFRQHSCLYVSRGGNFDSTKSKNQLKLFTKNKTPFWMVVFPEGTRYNPGLPETITKSRAFAKEFGWPVYNHLLTPRTRALELCIESLGSGAGSASAVYDVTTAYSSTLVHPGAIRTVAPSLADFLQGQCPRVHIHLRRVDIKTVPNGTEPFSAWLKERFQEKDRLLEKFYSSNPSESGSFGNDGRIVPLSLKTTLPAVLFFTALNAPLWLTVTGRAACWRLAVLGTIVSWAWVTIRY